MAIDTRRLRQFNLLGRSRRRRAPCEEALDRAKQPALTWYLDDRYGFAVVEEPGNPATARELARAVQFGPLLARLFLAVHALVLTAGELTVSVEDAWLATMLWGCSEDGRPRNWRKKIAELFRAAEVLWAVHLNEKKRWQYQKLIRRYAEVGDGHVVTVYGLMLGRLGEMANADRRLEIVARRADPRSPVRASEINDLRASDPERYVRYTKRDLRDAVRAERAADAGKPSLKRLGHAGGLWPLFLPGVLGDPKTCDLMGRLAVLLFREKTRGRPVTGATVPGWSGDTKVVCPLLDPAVEYVAFAANGGSRTDHANRRRTSRQGRGYRLDTWAERLGVSTDGLIEKLTVAARPLGLIVAGLDATGAWYDLDAIREAGPDVRGRMNVRVYTPADFVTRWCQAFRWNPSPARFSSDATPDDEIAALAAVIRDRGVRTVAVAVGISHSALSLIINRKRTPRPELLAKIRLQLRGAQLLGGTGRGSIFGGCQSMLDYALAYRRQGWSVVPMEPPKSPRKKPEVRTTPFFTQLPTERQLRKWWARWPDAGIGLILGPASGVFAIDVDGREPYDALVARLGSEPRAPKAMSGSGDPHRMHFFFRHPDGLRTKASVQPWHEHLEFRGHKGLLMLAPSPHRSGGGYRWADGQSIEDVALPRSPARGT